MRNAFPSSSRRAASNREIENILNSLVFGNWLSKVSVELRVKYASLIESEAFANRFRVVMNALKHRLEILTFINFRKDVSDRATSTSR